MKNPILENAIRLALKGETEPSSIDDFEDVVYPTGFYQEDGRIYLEKKDEDILISQTPCKLIARIRDRRSGRWGILLKWLDPDNLAHYAILFDGEIHKDKVLQLLISNGFRIMPGQGRAIAEMLMQILCDTRANITSDMGWDESNMLFITKEEIIAPEDHNENEPTAYVPDGSGRDSATSQSGEQDEWEEKVAIPSMQHPLMSFAIMAGFVSCILRFIINPA